MYTSKHPNTYILIFVYNFSLINIMPERQITLTTKGGSDAIGVQELDLDKLVPHASIIMIAKRGSGKSWVVRALIHHYAKSIPIHMIISPTEDINPFYKKFMPDAYIHPKFDSDKIRGILQRQQIIKDKARKREDVGKKPINTRALIVMDDCLAEKKDWSKDPTVDVILLNGRHYDITYILTMQFPLGISPTMRSNFDYVFLLADDTFSNQKRIFEHYAGIFPNFEAFRQIFGQLTQSHSAMVIINRDPAGNSVLDKIRHYKAPDLSKTSISIGGGQYNKYHNDNYNENWMKDNNPFAVNVNSKFEKSYMREKGGLVVKKLKSRDR